MKEIHRKRLKRLAEYLLTQVPEEQFDMGKYRWHKNSDQICGTAGCALGWSPAIMPESTFNKYKRRSSHLVELFSITIPTRYFGIEYDSRVWNYLFSGGWGCIDNTPQGAAARILHFLSHGTPGEFNYLRDFVLWDTSHYQKYLTTGA